MQTKFCRDIIEQTTVFRSGGGGGGWTQEYISAKPQKPTQIVMDSNYPWFRVCFEDAGGK